MKDTNENIAIHTAAEAAAVAAKAAEVASNVARDVATKAADTAANVALIASKATENVSILVNDISYIKRDISEIKTKLEKQFVTVDQFTPVRNIAYGLVTIILFAVVGALVGLVLVPTARASLLSYIL